MYSSKVVNLRFDWLNRRQLLPLCRVTAITAMLLLGLCLIGIPEFAIAQSQDEEGEFSAEGFNTLRIEQEDKLNVPVEQADAVWAFLQRYLVEDTTALQALDQGFTAYASEEYFVDTYFDTPTLQLLEMQSGVRHRLRTNLTNPEDNKSGRELLQVKVNNISANALERGEYKFDIAYPERIRVQEDGHPLFGIVKASHREALRQRLIELGLDPNTMRPILTLYDLRKRIYILRDNKSFMSISLDHVNAERLWATATLIEIEPELNEVAFTEADPAARQYMEEIGEKISTAIMREFPAVERELTPKYNKVFRQFETQIPLLQFLIRNDIDNMNSLVGLLFLIIVLPVVGGWLIDNRRKGVPAQRTTPRTVVYMSEPSNTN